MKPANGAVVEERWKSFLCKDGFTMPALLLTPREPVPAPGLLFISEPFGVNAEMQRVAGEFAAAGYVVAMPDLTSRGSWFSCVRALMGDLRRGHGRGVDDLLAAREWLISRREVEADRLAVMGLCMGGGFALILGKTGLFRVSAPFYGQTPQDMTGTCPVVASFGERDRMTRRHARHLGDELKRLDVSHDLKAYPGAGHSFMTRPPSLALKLLGPHLPPHARFDSAAATDATLRVLRFLAQHL